MWPRTQFVSSVSKLTYVSRGYIVVFNHDILWAVRVDTIAVRSVPKGMCWVIRMCARQHQVAEGACYRLREDTDGVRPTNVLGLTKNEVDESSIILLYILDRIFMWWTWMSCDCTGCKHQKGESRNVTPVTSIPFTSTNWIKFGRPE